MEVGGENQIGSLGQRKRQTIGQLERATTERPAPESAGDACDRIGRRIVGAPTAQQSGEAAAPSTAAEPHATAHAAAESRTGIALVALTRAAGPIEEEQTMVHD